MERERLQRGLRKLLGVMDLFIIFIVEWFPGYICTLKHIKFYPLNMYGTYICMSIIAQQSYLEKYISSIT